MRRILSNIIVERIFRTSIIKRTGRSKGIRNILPRQYQLAQIEIDRISDGYDKEIMNTLRTNLKFLPKYEITLWNF